MPCPGSGPLHTPPPPGGSAPTPRGRPHGAGALNATTPSRSRFRWDAGGYWGGLLGATVWLLVWGGVLIGEAPRLGVIVLACGLVPVVVGWLLWRRRRVISAHAAIQIVLACAGLGAALAALLVLRAADAHDPAWQHARWARQLLWGLLLFPGLMFLFWWMERRGRRVAGEDRGASAC